jgi:hypothetical protein
MLPFGVTIPATVPQGSEIPEGRINNPVFNASENVYIERTLHGKQGAENQFHFHTLSTFNDDTRLGSLRDARCSVYLSVCSNAVVIHAPDMVPRDDSDLLKQSHFNFLNYSEVEITFPPRCMKPTSLAVKFRT